MDGPSLLPLLMIVVGFVLVAPRVASSIGVTSDLFAQLFVPPDRTLPWPHGVQERDEAWHWQPPPAPTEPERPDDGQDGPAVFEISDLLDRDRWPRAGLVVELGPVPASRPHRAAA